MFGEPAHSNLPPQARVGLLQLGRAFPNPRFQLVARAPQGLIAGVTAHFVSMQLDEGPIIAQAAFTVRPGMTLKDIVAAGQKLETQVLLKAIGLYLSKRLDVYWGVVKQV